MGSAESHRPKGPPSKHTSPQEETRASGPSESPRIWTCDLCGTSMLDRHCKLVCQGCGYVRDCSDP